MTGLRYVDTSAFLKLLVADEHSAALRSALQGAARWSSSLLDVEAHRAARRLGVPSGELETALRSVSLVLPGPMTFALARSLPPSSLRTLDALHLATAIEMGDDLEAVVTYDSRLAAGCAEVGIDVDGPGLPPRWWSAAPAS